MQRATDDDSIIESRVRTILDRVRQGGDEVLRAITAEIDGVKAVVDIYSRTSAIAGWSVVALLRNLASPVCFF
mgnify:CR=1 FL=1